MKYLLMLMMLVVGAQARQADSCMLIKQVTDRHLEIIDSLDDISSSLFVMAIQEPDAGKKVLLKKQSDAVDSLVSLQYHKKNAFFRSLSFSQQYYLLCSYLYKEYVEPNMSDNYILLCLQVPDTRYKSSYSLRKPGYSFTSLYDYPPHVAARDLLRWKAHLPMPLCHDYTAFLEQLVRK